MDKEDLCKRCGECCYIKIKIGGDMIISDVPCPYLDEASKLCKVYERRHDFNQYCAQAEDAVLQGFAPTNCGYAPEGYRGARHPKSEIERIMVNIVARDALERLEWGPVKNADR